MNERRPADPRDRDRLADLYAPLLAFVLPLFLYLRTMATGLVWGDGIELAAVSATLGIAHPTGYPLFTMLGHVFAWAPLGSAYWRVTLMCAASVAGASLLLFCLLRALGELAWSEVFPSRRGRAILPLAGALGFAFCRAPWESATLTEVYSIELLFQLGIALAAYRVIEEKSPRGFLVLAFLFGLGMTHHMLTLTVAPFVVAAGAAVLWPKTRPKPAPGLTTAQAQNPPSKQSDLSHNSDLSDSSDKSDSSDDLPSPGHPRPPRLLLSAAGCFLLGLLPLLYLPIRASQSPALNWGDPSSPGRLAWTLSGGEFRRYRLLMEEPGKPFTAATYWQFAFQRTGDLGKYLGGQAAAPSDPGDPLWPVLAFVFAGFLALGVWRLARIAPRFTLALGASVAIYLLFLFTYNILDIRDYELGLLALLWPAVWVGFAEIPRWGALEWRRLGESSRAGRVAFLALAVPLLALFSNYRACDRSDFDAADRYARVLFQPLPQNAILLTAGDSDIYSAWYLQEVEGFRLDVLVYGSNFIFNDWYNGYFRGRNLDGRKVEAVPGTPTTDVAFVEALATHVIEPNIGRFEIYTTLDIPALRQRFTLTPVAGLISEEDIAEAMALGEYPPPPALYRVTESSGKPR